MSEIVFYRTYAQTLSSGRKETFEETVQRVENMHINKFPEHFFEIHQAMNFVREKKVVPSMRSMQYAGRAIELSNARMYNCSFTNIENFRDFADILFLLCCGCGCGYSVQKRHVSKLPAIKQGHEELFIIPDTKEGWAESVVHLLENPEVQFDYSKIRPRGAQLSTGGTASGPETLELMHENLRTIVKGAIGRKLKPLEVHDILCQIGDLIVSGGSRRSALISLFDVDDEEMMNCKAGWEWFNTHPHRARANNSAVLLRSSPTFMNDLKMCVRKCFENGTGEPGVFLTNDPDYGTNPCAEISLRSKQMCNLTEVNVAACKTKKEFIEAVEAAAALGTLQATYTNFEFIQPEWKKNCEEEALLGVSLTGLAQNWELISADGGATLEEAAQRAKEVNAEWAKRLGINPAARIGCVKPSGTTSALLGTTSGIHAAHAPYYLRRVRIESNSPITAYLLNILRSLKNQDDSVSDEWTQSSFAISPKSTPVYQIARLADECEKHIGLPLIETDVYSRQKLKDEEEKVQREEAEKARQKAEMDDAKAESEVRTPSPVPSPTESSSSSSGLRATAVPASLVVTMPINMSGSIVRDNEAAVSLLDRAAFIHQHFIQTSHRSGPNYHNVSLTVNYNQTQTVMKEGEMGMETIKGEEDAILNWIEGHTNCFAGIALFPDMTAGSKKYPQLPFEEVEKEVYEKWLATWKKLGAVAMEKKKSEIQASKKLLSIKKCSMCANISSTEGSNEEEEDASEETEKDVLKLLIEGMTEVEWDPNAADKRKEILACAGGNCEYV
ncbi:ribonucleoside-triphosphate reductase [Monocercomonoides exilis]|uniref:ribonucleoside-triphosphate reductase n=1 Tax=Monocercomonoides exilis TaxID=2049356 RepID=UPI0035594A16|nr:ribonucleoside-triphosphate reductase [Monocercomonoides exilis]